MGKDDSIIGAIGGLIAAIGNEVDIISPSSSPSTPSTSGSGSHSNGYGGSDGGSSTNWSGVTERTNAQGKPVHYVVRVGNKDNIYPAGLSGFFDAILGGKPIATSVYDGDVIHHWYGDGKSAGKSVVCSDGSIDSWSNKGKYLGSKKPDIPAKNDSRSTSNRNYSDGYYAPALEDGYHQAVAVAIEKEKKKAEKKARKEIESKRGVEDGSKEGKTSGQKGEKLDWDYAGDSNSYAKAHAEAYEREYERAYLESKSDGYCDGFAGNTATCSSKPYLEGFTVGKQRVVDSRERERLEGFNAGLIEGYDDGKKGTKFTWDFKRCSPAYSDGFRTGYEKAYSDKIKQLYQLGLKQGRQAAVSDAKDGRSRTFNYDGFSDEHVRGHKEGYTKQQYSLGLEQGRDAGFSDAKVSRTRTFDYKGYSDQYVKGHKEGYARALVEGSQRLQQKAKDDYEKGMNQGLIVGKNDVIYNKKTAFADLQCSEEYAQGFKTGYENGYSETSKIESDRGYLNGCIQGEEDARKKRRKVLSNTGYSEKYIQGYKVGYDEGFNGETKLAYGHGFEQGKTLGETATLYNLRNSFSYKGYTEEFIRGHKDGYRRGCDNVYSQRYNLGLKEGGELGAKDASRNERRELKYEGPSAPYIRGHKEGYRQAVQRRARKKDGIYLVRKPGEAWQ